MKLGILVNTDENLEAVTGLARAALEKGHEVIIFCMDRGTLLFQEPAFRDLNSMGARMSFCSHNAGQLGLDVSGLPEDIVCGSQFDNAFMQHNADKVLVL